MVKTVHDVPPVILSTEDHLLSSVNIRQTQSCQGIFYYVGTLIKDAYMMATTDEASRIDRKAHAEKHRGWLLQNSPLYAHLFQHIEVTSASPTKVTCTLELFPLHLNSKGSLHGSVSATLVDYMGGLAIACFDERDNTGVSTDMHISFIGGAKTGDTLDLEGRVEKCGDTLAFTTITIRKLEAGKPQGTGALVATGRHTKFVRK